MEGIQSDQQCLALSRIVPLVDTFLPQRYPPHLCRKVLSTQYHKKNFPRLIIILQLILTLRNN